MVRSMFYIFLLLNGVFSDEALRSRFHYDEQLLEKIIRLEVKVETMEKVILNANELLHQRQEEVKDSLNALKSEREDLQRDYADTKVKSAEDSNKMKDYLRTPTIVFKARQPNDVSLETGQRIVFSKSMINEGEAYDNITGIFTAPVGGTYLFSIHLCVPNKQYLYYGIVRDHIVETSGVFYDGAATICHTADAMIVLEAGQNVWVKCLSGGGGTTRMLYEYTSSTYNNWNTFSGLLVHV